MCKPEVKSRAENYTDAVTELRTLSNAEIAKLVTDTRKYQTAYHSWWLRALATVEHERITGRTIANV